MNKLLALVLNQIQISVSPLDAVHSQKNPNHFLVIFKYKFQYYTLSVLGQLAFSYQTFKLMDKDSSELYWHRALDIGSIRAHELAAVSSNIAEGRLLF
jgi:hypothetical protein